MRRSRLLPLITAVACGGAPPDPSEDDEEIPYVVDLDDEPAPATSVAALELAVQGAFDAVLTLTAEPVFAAYGEAVGDHDANCPAIWQEVGTAVQWYGDCITEGGVRYAGYGHHESYEGPSPDDPALHTVYRYLLTSSTVVTADGRTFVGAGGAVLLTAAKGGQRLGTSVVRGTFAWDGPAAHGTWLDDEVELDLELGWLVDTWGQGVSMTGAVLRPGAPPVTFDGVLLVDAICAGEPQGTVSIRGDDGWYDVVFDFDAEALESLDLRRCDGCGTAWYRGQEVGEVCVDVAALPAFEVPPW